MLTKWKSTFLAQYSSPYTAYSQVIFKIYINNCITPCFFSIPSILCSSYTHHFYNVPHFLLPAFDLFFVWFCPSPHSLPTETSKFFSSKFISSKKSLFKNPVQNIILLCTNYRSIYSLSFLLRQWWHLHFEQPIIVFRKEKDNVSI